ncbi:hypothetical protein HFP43_02470 [Streptomyces sp. SJ1-7]|nr:hypothetical protein [Streptomyces sp. SJ1-7]
MRVGTARWNLGHVLLASEHDAADVAMDTSHDLAALDAPGGRHSGVH